MLIQMKLPPKLTDLDMSTHMTLTLADCSVTYPYGILEEVLVKVDNLVFPTDSVILNIPEDAGTPIILEDHSWKNEEIQLI